ncbi:hypothetical protein D3C75_1071540 [compost metagenome]
MGNHSGIIIEQALPYRIRGVPGQPFIQHRIGQSCQYRLIVAGSQMIQDMGRALVIISQGVAQIDAGLPQPPACLRVRSIKPVKPRVLHPFRGKSINAEEGFGKLRITQQ